MNYKKGLKKEKSQQNSNHIFVYICLYRKE